jgi:hypothetical protein
VYMLPLLILGAILWHFGKISIGNISGLGLLSMGTSALATLAGTALKFGIYLIIMIVVAIAFGILSTSAVLTYAHTRKFGSAFEFSSIAKRAFSGHYILNWFLTMVVGGGLGAVICNVPGIGPFISIAIIGIISFTNLAQAYTEA